MLLLCTLLSRRMAHLQRTVPWGRLAAATRRVEQRILAGAAVLLQLDPGEGPHGAAVAACPALMQVTLAIRHGGFGFRATSPVEADAALLAGAAKAEAAMADTPATRRRFMRATAASVAPRARHGGHGV